MAVVLVRVTIAVMKHTNNKANRGWGGLFGLCFQSLFIIEGRQGKNSNRAGTWSQEQMERALITGLLPIACSACFIDAN